VPGALLHGAPAQTIGREWDMPMRSVDTHDGLVDARQRRRANRLPILTCQGHSCTAFLRIKGMLRCTGGLRSCQERENGLRPSATCARRAPPTSAKAKTARPASARRSSLRQSAGTILVEWFYDGAVKGADPVETRPGFAAMLARIAGNGARTIIVETANRFARDLMVQEVGFKMLCDQGIALIAATVRLLSLTMAPRPS